MTGTEASQQLSVPFRWYLTARLTSEFGDRALIVVLPFAAIALGAGPFEVAVLLIAGQLPLILGLSVVSAFGGLLPRRPALVASDTVRGLIQAAVFVLFATGTASFGMIVAVQALSGLISAVSIPVAEASVADLVPSGSRQRANALFGSGRSLIRVVAPAAAAALAVVFGVSVLFLVDALSFVISAAIVAALAFPRTETAPPPRGRLAIKAIRSKRWLVVTSAGAAAINALAVAPVLVLGPVLLARQSGGAGAWGVLMAAFGIGATIGGLLLMRIPVGRPLQFAFMTACFVSIFPLSLAIGLPIGLLCVAAFLTGMQATIFNAVNETTRQNCLEEELRVQGSAFATLLAFGLSPIGLALAGGIAEVTSDVAILYGAAVFGVTVPALVLLDKQVWRMSAAGRPAAVGS